MFEVLLGRSAEKDLRRLPNPIHDRIVRVVSALSKNPQLTGSENDWRIRVGDYRVIYEIADANRIVRINRVRHRKEVYR